MDNEKILKAFDNSMTNAIEKEELKQQALLLAREYSGFKIPQTSSLFFIMLGYLLGIKENAAEKEVLN